MTVELLDQFESVSAAEGDSIPQSYYKFLYICYT